MTKLGLLLAAIAVLGVALFCTGMHSIPIQNMVQGNAAEAVQAASIGGVKIAADGRDITLTGTVPSEAVKQHAGEVAQAATGVRTVDNELVVNQLPPAPDVKAVQTKINQILIDKRIEFATSKDVLLPASIPVLQQVLDVVKQEPQLHLQINGHTDSAGDPDMNRELSKARAEAVVAWFAEHGIAKDRMKAAGFGADKPIAPNSSAAGRFANRRVEIIAN
jgi:outer membrane protein OmpA-like peptidoglycan-associated protein